jgi:hypothetical protein
MSTEIKTTATMPTRRRRMAWMHSPALGGDDDGDQTTAVAVMTAQNDDGSTMLMQPLHSMQLPTAVDGYRWTTGAWTTTGQRNGA